ncbi:P-II family nitrogen regulator [Pararhizobium qamdonense]|uniref:P-II family nitrogen regulator n=1 Tax=Pararhizobium qamdonense TaxID=3031126 RepID=UPI0023E17983|nr:P-II family nitrogen regulator [Pararhizobium qamdonense]
MVKIEFVTRAFRILDIRTAVDHLAVDELLVMEARFCGSGTPVIDVIRGLAVSTEFIPCLKVELLVRREHAVEAVEAIRAVASDDRTVSDSITVSAIAMLSDPNDAPARDMRESFSRHSAA